MHCAHAELSISRGSTCKILLQGCIFLLTLRNTWQPSNTNSIFSMHAMPWILFQELVNQLSDLVSKFLGRNIARGAKNKINGQFCFCLMHIKGVWPVLTLTVVLIASLTYSSLVNQVLCSSPNNCAHNIYWIFLCWCSVYPFVLIVSSGMKCFCTQKCPKRFPKLHHKTWVYVAYSYLGNSKTSHNMYKEQLHCLSCSQYLITDFTRNEKCVFGEAIHTSENCVTYMREW